MGLGLQLHLQQVLHNGRHALPPNKLLLGDLHALSRFPDNPTRETNKRSVYLLDLGFEDHARRLPGQFSCGFGQIRQLRLRRTLLKKGARNSRKLTSGRVVASLGESELEPEVLGCSLVAGMSTGGLFWQPFWTTGLADSGASSSGLGFSGSGGDSGGGDGGGGGGDGGNGGFDPSGGEIHVNGVVDKKESGDEEQAAKSPDFRAPGLASLSSAAGDALDGEAPFGDLLLGRKKRAAAKVPFNKGTTGGIFRKLDEAAHNFLSPNNGNHREPSGKNSHLRKSYVYNVSYVFLELEHDNLCRY